MDLILHWIFEGSLVVKAAMAAAEFLSGVLLYFVDASWVVDLVRRITIHELERHPHDRVAAALLQQTETFSPDVQTFYAYYLAGHGLIKLALVVGLWRGARWSYPASLAALALFVAYQMHLWLASQSPLMLVLTIFDLIVMALIWREWRREAPVPA